MGLDMYLEKSTYIGANFPWRTLHGELVLVNNEGEENESSLNLLNTVQLDRVSEITENVAYWRKANHIHAWFVSNVQDGIDECQRSYVSYEQLVELRDTCKEVLADRKKADALLPTQAGFFFGGTEYDEYYFQDLEYTVEILDKILGEENAESVSYYYQSSW